MDLEWSFLGNKRGEIEWASLFCLLPDFFASVAITIGAHIHHWQAAFLGQNRENGRCRDFGFRKGRRFFVISGFELRHCCIGTKVVMNEIRGTFGQKSGQFSGNGYQPSSIRGDFRRDFCHCFGKKGSDRSLAVLPEIGGVNCRLLIPSITDKSQNYRLFFPH